jgi:hypothetical protein
VTVTAWMGSERIFSAWAEVGEVRAPRRVLWGSAEMTWEKDCMRGTEPVEEDSEWTFPFGQLVNLSINGDHLPRRMSHRYSSRYPLLCSPS